MITIKKALPVDSELLVKLGRETYVESHGHYIKRKSDLEAYLQDAFSEEKIYNDLKDQNVTVFIAYFNNKAVGYVKLIAKSTIVNIEDKNTCQLERIYVRKEFTSQKVGYKLIQKALEFVTALNFNFIWLSVYVKNERAINFYNRIGFKDVGFKEFLVNGTNYINKVLVKDLKA